MLEVFSEKRLIREVELIGDLLDCERSLSQHYLRFHNHVVVYEFACRQAGDLLSYSGKMFWRDTEPIGIESHTPLPSEILKHFNNEAG